MVNTIGNFIYVFFDKILAEGNPKKEGLTKPPSRYRLLIHGVQLSGR